MLKTKQKKTNKATKSDTTLKNIFKNISILLKSKKKMNNDVKNNERILLIISLTTITPQPVSLTAAISVVTNITEGGKMRFSVIR